MTTLPGEFERSFLVRGLDPEGRRQLCQLVSFESFPVNARILEQGRVYQAVWVIVTGRCEVVRTCGPGQERQLAVLEPGGIFGEMSFLDEAPHSADVRTLSAADTIRLTRDAFESLREEHPGTALIISANLVRLLSERLRRMDQLACELADDGRHHAEWRDFQHKLYSDWAY
jgi:CRP-like cAMP-binding protein